MKNLDYNQIIYLEIIGEEDKYNIYIIFFLNLTKFMQFCEAIWRNHDGKNSNFIIYYMIFIFEY